MLKKSDHTDQSGEQSQSSQGEHKSNPGSLKVSQELVASQKAPNQALEQDKSETGLRKQQTVTYQSKHGEG